MAQLKNNILSLTQELDVATITTPVSTSDLTSSSDFIQQVREKDETISTLKDQLKKAITTYKKQMDDKSVNFENQIQNLEEEVKVFHKRGEENERKFEEMKMGKQELKRKTKQMEEEKNRIGTEN